MPKIPRFQISRDPHISGEHFSTRPPSDIGVAKAAPTRIVGSGENIFAQSLDDVSQALKDISEVFALKQETARVSESQRIQMEMSNIFREKLKEASTKTGGQAAGLTDTLRDSESELRESFIPEGLDTKTTQELNTYFDRQYNTHAMRLVQHEIRQADVADKVARNLVIQNAHQNIISFPVGDIMSVEQEVIIASALETERHPNLTENQKAINERALREEFLTYALTKWSAENPSATVAFWDNKENQKYLKTALPKHYPTMTHKIESIREDASVDDAIRVALSLAKNDYSEAADIILEKGTSKEFGLSESKVLELYSSFSKIASQQYAIEEREKTIKIEEFLYNSHEKFYDPKTKVLDLQGALLNLEQGRRDKIIPSNIYDYQIAKLLKGSELSTETTTQLFRDINNEEVTTRGEILEVLAYTSTPPQAFYTALDKKKKDKEQGFTTNWMKRAENRYRKAAEITKTKDLPSDFKPKEWLVNPLELDDFMEDLEEAVRREGYTANDPRIKKLADELMEGGYYHKYSGWHPGEAKSWLIFGEEYGLKYQYDPEQLYKEGKLSESAYEKSKTATGGNATGDTARFQRLMETPEGQGAYKRLLDENITPTPENVEEAMKLILQEKGIIEDSKTSSSTISPTLLTDLERHEGFRGEVYLDSKGNATIGYGHLVKPGEDFSRGVSKEEAKQLLKKDTQIAINDAKAIFKNLESFSKKRQEALVNMTFNLGRTKLIGFTKMLKELNSTEVDWERVADEAKNSLWYKEVGRRSKEIVKILREG